MRYYHEMIDSHCHLDFEAFDHDREAVIAHARENGVHDIVVPAVSASTFDRTIQLCERHQGLHLALGLHPVFIEQHQPQDLITLDRCVEQYQPIAIGEIGLDFFNKHSKEKSVPNRDKQVAFFTKQLIIAKQHNLPLIIHNRKAHDQCLALLAEIGCAGGIIHAFNGSIQQAEKYIELGYLLGFGGMLTFERSTKLRKLAEQIPLSSIALETDAPDMTVQAHAGERNSPAYLPFVQSALSAIKQVGIGEVAQVTSHNVVRTLNLSCKLN